MMMNFTIIRGVRIGVKNITSVNCGYVHIRSKWQLTAYVENTLHQAKAL